MSMRVYHASKIFLRGHVASRAQCCSMSMNKFLGHLVKHKWISKGEFDAEDSVIRDIDIAHHISSSSLTLVPLTVDSEAQ